MKKIAVLSLLVIISISFIWLFLFKYENKSPTAEIDLPSVYLKKSGEMSLVFEDDKTGISEIKVTISQGTNEKVLLEKQYEDPGILKIFSSEPVKRQSFLIPLESWKYGVSDGEVLIRITAADNSWKSWGKGNVLYIEKKLIIDSKPPKIEILSKRHNVEKGGSGLVIYKLFEEKIKSGVLVGSSFFPGYPGLFKDKAVHAAFFALTDNQGPGTKLAVTAEDQAGNISKAGFYFYIRDKKFKTDILNISESFLEKKMPEFDLGLQESNFEKGENQLLEKFVYINETVRRKNVEDMLKLYETTENVKHWEGRFLRLAGSARRAGFADRRIYKYKGKEISRAVHFGIDLASTSHASIKAANAGRIAFAENNGIFGNTVVIDHGFGLYSLYSHLSDIAVARGDMVNKADEIGRSGLTGLAGGDHLHFSMIVHNVFVNPVEWWDASWIRNNITSKIDDVNQMTDKG